MNDFEERYKSPVSVESTANTTRLTRDEWWYAGKTFVMATVGAALFRGAWHAWQTIDAFGAKGEVEAFLAVGSMRHFGSVVALFGVCVALFLVVRRRAKAGVPPPNHGLLWPMFLIVPLCAPLAGLVMAGACTGVFWLGFGPVWSYGVKLALKTFALDNAHAGISIGAATSLVYAVFSAQLARGAERTHKWPILVCFAAWFVTAWTTELVAYPVKFALSRIGLAPMF